MDAVEFLVTRDRMCGSFNVCCTGCEVNECMGADDICNGRRIMISYTVLGEKTPAWLEA